MFARALDWYLDTLGMIVSDFLFLDGQRERGPTMAFLLCDQGSPAVDHHTLAMRLGPANGYVHSAYQVTDLDSITVRPARTGAVAARRTGPPSGVRTAGRGGGRGCGATR